jgi:T-complex protein 1 subunit theta
VNIEESGVIDAVRLGIFDCLRTKMNAIRLAADAALAVLSVDQIIMAKPAGGPKAPPQGAPDDD